MSARTCRFCGHALETTFVDLGMSPVSNAFLKAEQLGRMEPFFPLHAYVCTSCWLVQLEQFESRDRIFNEEYGIFPRSPTVGLTMRVVTWRRCLIVLA